VPYTCARKVYFSGGWLKILHSGEVQILIKRALRARRTHQKQKKHPYYVILQSRLHVHVPKKSIFSGAGYKIYVPVKFEF